MVECKNWSAPVGSSAPVRSSAPSARVASSSREGRSPHRWPGTRTEAVARCMRAGSLSQLQPYAAMSRVLSLDASCASFFPVGASSAALDQRPTAPGPSDAGGADMAPEAAHAFETGVATSMLGRTSLRSALEAANPPERPLSSKASEQWDLVPHSSPYT